VWDPTQVIKLSHGQTCKLHNCDLIGVV
jgi:hypothetical protein